MDGDHDDSDDRELLQPPAGAGVTFVMVVMTKLSSVHYSITATLGALYYQSSTIHYSRALHSTISAVSAPIIHGARNGLQVTGDGSNQG